MCPDVVKGYIGLYIMLCGLSAAAMGAVLVLKKQFD